jgi:NADP-dependent 3-hydroxy acid dehydrogenase YdfG
MTRKLEMEDVAMEDVAGKVAMITGAPSGQGRVFSVTLAERGCNVVIAARRVQLFEDAVQRVQRSCRCVFFDLGHRRKRGVGLLYETYKASESCDWLNSM